MTLQSQKTVRYKVEDLERYVAACTPLPNSRPKRNNSWAAWALAGMCAGLLIVLLFRMGTQWLRM